MIKETLLPTSEREQRGPIEDLVRDFQKLARSNREARIYLIGYTSRTERLEYVKNVSEGGRMMTDLLNTRKVIVSYGAPADKVVIVAVLVQDALKADRIGATLTPVKLPIEVWNGDGLQTGEGQSPPRVSGSISIEDDYNKKTGGFDKKIQVEVQIKLKAAVRVVDSLTLTAKHDGSAFEEANAEVSFKTKILKALRSYPIKDLTLAIKASGNLSDNDDTPERKLEKIKGKLKAMLSTEIKAISGTVSGSFFVDSKGGVGAGAEITIPWD